MKTLFKILALALLTLLGVPWASAVMSLLDAPSTASVALGVLFAAALVIYDYLLALLGWHWFVDTHEGSSE